MAVIIYLFIPFTNLVIEFISTKSLVLSGLYPSHQNLPPCTFFGSRINVVSVSIIYYRFLWCWGGSTREKNLKFLEEVMVYNVLKEEGIKKGGSFGTSTPFTKNKMKGGKHYV